eukprot:TRINITY_DN8742_c0_g3_i1.p1 TRINITY_DN8742_c0_g3~~TRINITY_DN8742_c0_g3_i1.p1  ORF type:complete len:388 (+),score=99.65 TRINITY_DN8742_c0_g3_i1:1-1164(+)
MIKEPLLEDDTPGPPPHEPTFQDSHSIFKEEAEYMLPMNSVYLSSIFVPLLNSPPRPNPSPLQEITQDLQQIQHDFDHLDGFLDDKVTLDRNLTNIKTFLKFKEYQEIKTSLSDFTHKLSQWTASPSRESDLSLQDTSSIPFPSDLYDLRNRIIDYRNNCARLSIGNGLNIFFTYLYLVISFIIQYGFIFFLGYVTFFDTEKPCGGNIVLLWFGLFLYCSLAIQDILETTDMFKWLWNIPRDSGVAFPGYFEIRGDRLYAKVHLGYKFVVLLVIFFKGLLGVTLFVVGGLFITRSDSNTSIILNTVALFFVTSIDETIFSVYSPWALKVGLEKVPKKLRKEKKKPIELINLYGIVFAVLPFLFLYLGCNLLNPPLVPSNTTTFNTTS